MSKSVSLSIIIAPNKKIVPILNKFKKISERKKIVLPTYRLNTKNLAHVKAIAFFCYNKMYPRRTPQNLQQFQLDFQLGLKPFVFRASKWVLFAFQFSDVLKEGWLAVFYLAQVNLQAIFTSFNFFFSQRQMN